jgi:hypothetical protein
MIDYRQIAITLDIDWAPDFVIDFAAERLIAGGVRATWFITHESPAVERLKAHPDLFELGIHPNFLAGSSHGSTPEDVLAFCAALVPEARCVRTHALVQSSPLLEQFSRRGIPVDVSLFLPHTPGLRPVDTWFRNAKLLRIPYFWEDDSEMCTPDSMWHVNSLLEGRALSDGHWDLRIFDFHPIHIYLNSADMRPYEALKRDVPRLSEAAPTLVEPHVYGGDGTRTLFDELVGYLSAHEGGARISDIAAMWSEETR